MTFLDMYGEELDIQLASEDRTNLFTTARRKAQVNKGMREFVRLTECVTRTANITMVDETGTYDVEASITDFWWLAKQRGISIGMGDGVTPATRVLSEGRDLTRVDERRMDREHPGWQTWSPGTPKYIYTELDSGATQIGFAPAPSIPDDEEWGIHLHYIPHVADMSADADEPFTFSGNVVKRLRAWHMAPVHYAAYKLETARKMHDRAADQLALFSALVKDHHDKQQMPGGDVVAFAHDYHRGTRRPGVFAGDPMVDW